VKILQDAMVKTFNDPGFHRDYKKLTGDEPTPLMPEEMDKAIKDPTPLMPEAHEKAVRDLPRDREIVELFKKIAGGGPLPPR